jgi:hypothetical protein
LIVIEAGTCTTGTLLSDPVAAVPKLVCVRSPPPYAPAVFDTEVGEFVGTFTVSASVVNDAPPLTPCDDAHVTVPFPEQLQPAPL